MHYHNISGRMAIFMRLKWSCYENVCSNYDCNASLRNPMKQKQSTRLITFISLADWLDYACNCQLHVFLHSNYVLWVVCIELDIMDIRWAMGDIFYFVFGWIINCEWRVWLLMQRLISRFRYYTMKYCRHSTCWIRVKPFQYSFALCAKVLNCIFRGGDYSNAKLTLDRHSYCQIVRRNERVPFQSQLIALT